MKFIVLDGILMKNVVFEIMFKWWKLRYVDFVYDTINSDIRLSHKLVRLWN